MYTPDRSGRSGTLDHEDRKQASGRNSAHSHSDFQKSKKSANKS